MTDEKKDPRRYHPCGVCELCFDFCRCEPKPAPKVEGKPKVIENGPNRTAPIWPI